MNRWFGSDELLDQTIASEFGDLVKLASDGELMDWTDIPTGTAGSDHSARPIPKKYISRHSRCL